MSEPNIKSDLRHTAPILDLYGRATRAQAEGGQSITPAEVIVFPLGTIWSPAMV